MSSKRRVLVFQTGFDTDAYLAEFARGIEFSSTGHQSLLVPPNVSVNDFRNTDIVVCFGVLRGAKILFDFASSNNLNYLHLDHAYFWRGYTGDCWLRVTVNGTQLKRFPDKRINDSRSSVLLDQYLSLRQPIQLAEQKVNALLPPTKAMKFFYQDQQEFYLCLQKFSVEWLLIEKPLEYEVNNLGYPIKKIVRENAIPITRILPQCSSFVTYNSIAAIDAIDSGVPTWGWSNSILQSIDRHIDNADDSTLNCPITDYQYTLLYRNLFAHQFTRDERYTGVAWQHVCQMYPNLRA